jgi:hypothetical protein
VSADTLVILAKIHVFPTLPEIPYNMMSAFQEQISQDRETREGNWLKPYFLLWLSLGTYIAPFTLPSVV